MSFLREHAHRRRTASLVAAVAVLAVLGLVAAGCGGKPSTPSVAQIGTSATTTDSSAATGSTGDGSKLQSGTQFSACMRSHGVPKFPDPTSGGGIQINSSTLGMSPDSPVFQRAQAACRKLLPNGGRPSAAQQQKALAQALKFSQCMRSHGVPNFPDPQATNGGIGLKIGRSSGIDPSSTSFQAAQKACQDALPGFGKGGGGRVTAGGGGAKNTAVAP